ncbi:hypothetical protein NAP1_15508 [Erythrobacter sp. NAP1]|nr:hypothetical protein NAP1_15508 [Erythrobacter sp. NAP1]
MNRALGIPGNYGFTFQVDKAVKQGADIELYASDGERVVLVHKRPAEASVSAPAVGDVSQILNAKTLADQPDSVAITCWDGGHNPIGRAMVLHDSVAKRRPVVLFAYLFPDFGGAIWPPIDGEMFNRVLIPWEKRATYLEYIRSLNIEFSTVWMCKPRLPTFELAANISGKNSRFILDHDDNEVHFSRSKPTRQFGFYAMSLGKHLASKVTANTVASVSLAEEVNNAVIVRHAREPVQIDADVSASPPSFVVRTSSAEEASSFGASTRQNPSSSEDSITAIKKLGLHAMSLANHLASKVSSNNVANPSPIESDSEDLATHSSSSEAVSLEAQGQIADAPVFDDPTISAGSSPIKIGFVGTVREHKGLIEAARLIRLLAWESGQPYEFHVYGDFNPDSLRERLDGMGAVTHGQVPREELSQILRSFDVILSGCTPAPGSEDITRYQISSKIGDALAVERPVLVPNGPSVADLGEIPGVYLFDAGGLGDAVQAAMSTNEDITLPPEFTLDGAFEAFEAAEDSANSIFDDLSPLRFGGSEPRADRTLVLLWKQTDAGFFGRRVDQLARTYQQKYPDHRVIVLEFCHKSEIEHLRKTAPEFTSPNGPLHDLTEKKRAFSEIRNGVEYHMIENQNVGSMQWNFEKYLMDNRLDPTNTRFVIYPLVKQFKEIAKTLASFDCVIDCVDNQLSWNSGTKRIEASVEYLKILKSGSRIVFNSQENHDFFMDPDRWGDLEPPSNERVLVAPNWYDPEAYAENQPSLSEGDEPFKVVYSGNLSDRIDWDLMSEVADRLPLAEFHVVGGIRNPDERFDELLERSNVVYWGPLSERRLSELLGQCHVGIVPHCADDVATFMNPLKVHMYREFGLPVISTQVPGIAPGEGLTLCGSPEEFIEKLAALSENRPQRDHSASGSTLPQHVDHYISMLAEAPSSPS